MKIKEILKKMSATVLVFAMLAPIMSNLDVSVVKAQEIDMSEVLSVKIQVTEGIVTDTTIDKYRNKYVMRFVSSIENLDYTYVGFDVSYTDENGQVITKTNKTKKIFNRIESTTGSTEKGKDEYSFGPKVVSTASQYLITAKLPVAVDDKDVDYTVQAFGIKTDGTTVYGPKRCVSVEDGLAESNRINLSIDATLDENASYTAGYTNASGKTVTIDSDNVKVLSTGEASTTVRLLNADKNLKSVTEITLKDSQGNIVATEDYRNLYTKYTGEGTEDTTWYEMYKETNEFVIATSAELYGFAELSKTIDFGHKTIMLGSDIVVNNGEAANWESSPAEYSWGSIGNADKRFAGTFDGNMHTISGLYFKAEDENRGLFGATSGASTIKNLYLKNSYFESTAKNLGGIAGQGRGTFHTVYSNATIKSDDGRVGGIVGMAYGTAVVLQNCWNEGSVINTAVNRSHNGSSEARGTGGLIGVMYSSKSGETIARIENCLNKGTVDVTASTGETATMGGGLVGSVMKGANLTVVDSLNLSDVNAPSGKFAGVMVGCVDAANLRITTSYGYGTEKVDSIVGWMQNSSQFLADYYYPISTLVEAADRSSGQGGSSLESAYRKIAIMFINKTEQKSHYGSIQGAAASTNLPGLDFNNTWKIQDNATPVLKFDKPM